MIDLGPTVFKDGMVYVAMSRVHTFDGVALLDLVSHKIKASTFVHQEMTQLRDAH